MRKIVEVKVMSEIKREALTILATFSLPGSLLGLLNFVMWNIWNDMYYVVAEEREAFTEFMADWHMTCGLFCFVAVWVGVIAALTYYIVCKLRSNNGVVVFERLERLTRE